jgi:hypothetical protein
VIPSIEPERVAVDRVRPLIAGDAGVDCPHVLCAESVDEFWERLIGRAGLPSD